MALDTVVLQQDPFGNGYMDIYTIGGGSTGPWIHGFNNFEGEKACNNETLIAAFGSTLNSNIWSLSAPNVKEWDTNSFSQESFPIEGYFPPLVDVPAPTTTSQRRKRKRSRNFKNQEEVEHQRMTHITVERNRRKQMNDYLSALRSMMPPSYVQRGDQASIVGGAINFVKELEQLLQSLEAHKRIKKESTEMESSSSSSSSSSLFSYFFTFPQYSTSSDDQSTGKKRSAIKADVEVTMVESHANLKILIRRQPKQLLKIVGGLYSLCLGILHINVTTTVDHMVLYSFSVKAEEECQLTSVNEIATAVYEMVGRIQDQTVPNIS